MQETLWFFFLIQRTVSIRRDIGSWGEEQTFTEEAPHSFSRVPFFPVFKNKSLFMCFTSCSKFEAVGDTKHLTQLQFDPNLTTFLLKYSTFASNLIGLTCLPLHPSSSKSEETTKVFYQ